MRVRSWFYRTFPAFVPEYTNSDDGTRALGVGAKSNLDLCFFILRESEENRNRCESWFIMTVASVIIIMFGKWWSRRQWAIAQHFLNHFLVSWWGTKSPFNCFLLRAPEKGEIIGFLQWFSLLHLTMLWFAKIELSHWLIPAAAFSETEFPISGFCS